MSNTCTYFSSAVKHGCVEAYRAGIGPQSLHPLAIEVRATRINYLLLLICPEWTESRIEAALPGGYRRETLAGVEPDAVWRDNSEVAVG